MTTSQLRPRIGVTIVLLATALALLAQHPGTSRAEGSADNAQDIDLAKMVLPVGAFGPDFARHLTKLWLGFDPRDRRDPRELNDYSFTFATQTPGTSDAVQINMTVGLLSTPEDAVGFISDTKSAIRTAYENAVMFQGSYNTFAVPEIDGAVGYFATFWKPNVQRYHLLTGVIFPLDRLVGGIAFLAFNETDLESTAISAATALNQRMKGVLSGKITDFPAPLPPDVNCNGDVNSIDATLILQLDAGLVASLPCDALADANQDGHTNSIDASLILQYSAGLIDRLPV